MAKIKLTKSAVDAAQPQAQAVELRDTLVPGFLCKITPTGRKVFMLQYRTNAGERRKPALGQYGELTVEQMVHRFRVSPNVVYYWIDRGVIRARRLTAGTPYWITLDEADEQKLRDWVCNSRRIQQVSSIPLEESAL